MKHKVDLLLDSGAFSAWTRKEVIPLNEYIAFCKEYEQYLWAYVNMDVIPGERDKPRTQEQVEASAQGSLDNLKRMHDAGLRPMAVFHQGESWETLQKLLDEGETYIGVSAFKDISIHEQRKFLDQAFTVLCDAKGRPLVRTHGFGTTHPALLLRYPWYTVDSTTWLLTPAYGQFLVPTFVNGKPDYSQIPTRVALSDVIHKNKSSNQMRFEYQGPNLRKLIKEWIENEVGETMARVRYFPNARRKVVAVYYKKLCELLKDVRFKHPVAGAFREKVHVPSTLKPIRGMQCRLVFATNTSPEQAAVLNECNITDRLLSYYELKDKPKAVIPYVTRGTTGALVYEPKRPRQNWGPSYNTYRRMELVRRLKNERTFPDGVVEEP